MPVTLRPITPEDGEFLFAVYASTRDDEMRLVDWDAEQKESFLRMQFAAQCRYYVENYSRAEFWIILLEDQPIGRLYVLWGEQEIRIIDFALLPEYRHRGIGSRLLHEILGEAEKNALPVTIHVERFNPALRLYERLGFCLAEDKGMYYFLKWSPAIGDVEEHDRVG